MATRVVFFLSIALDTPNEKKRIRFVSYDQIEPLR